VTRLGLVAVALVLLTSAAYAQDPPPRIGPWVLDLHATMPSFPQTQAVADSYGVQLGELPSRGLGVHAAAYVYPYQWKVVTFGVGADMLAARARVTDPPLDVDVFGRTTVATFTQIAPDLSFNFGDGEGWSYISGGIGPSVWAVVPDGGPILDVNNERVAAINYGGGAHWFMKHQPRLAFSFDVRFYDVKLTQPANGLPGRPHTKLLFFSAGISLK
jgi:hypothetical protein